MQTILFIIGKRQVPTVWHRELYLISCDKPKWKRILKSIYIYVCVHIYMCMQLNHFGIQLYFDKINFLKLFGIPPVDRFLEQR